MAVKEETKKKKTSNAKSNKTNIKEHVEKNESIEEVVENNNELVQVIESEGLDGLEKKQTPNKDQNDGKNYSELDYQMTIIKREEKQKKKDKEEHKEYVRYNPSIKEGLTSSQVDERVENGLVNFVEDKNKKSYAKIIFSNIFTFFNLLCFIVAGALIAVGAFSNIFFIFIVLANILIGIIQECKAKKTIEKIKIVTSPTIRVIRDKVEQEIQANQLVLDDIIILSTGKQIPADSVVCEGEVEVNESLLTGESVPIKKKKGDMLLAGSFIVGGKCFARAEKVGSQTYVSKLSNKATKFKKPQSDLLKSMNLVIKIVGLVIIPLAIITYLNVSKINSDIAFCVKRTAGVVIGVIPSGMFLLTSLALAAGVIKLAKKRTLVQDLYSIEMLARTTVLCLDKTGTITDGTMKVNTVVQVDPDFNIPVGDVVGSMLTALDDNNSTSRALSNHFGYSKEFTAKTILPFTSSRKLSAVTFKNGDTYVYGAPEFVYKTKNKALEAQIRTYASKGFRVLLLAKCEHEIEKDKLLGNKHPIALIVIEDHIREDAEESIKWFNDNGVDIKIISGDNPITVSEVSKRVGVLNADKYVSLEGLTEEQVLMAVDKYTIFGRVTPEQKCIIVKALKNKGHKVAMTGDGVNDILALKEADCSIAMASGSEAARHVSNLVLLDSNFSSMPSVVAEGRRVVNNVQNSSSLFLMKTIFVALVALITPLLGISYPFITNHLMLLEFFVIGLPSFFLALQPNSDRINGDFLRNLLAKSLPAGLLFFVGFLACFLVYKLGIVNMSEYVTMASLTVSCTGMVVLLRLCKPFNAFRGFLYISSLILIGLAMFIVPFSFFEYVPLSLQNVLFIVVFVQASYPVYSTFVKWFDLSQVNNKNNQ